VNIRIAGLAGHPGLEIRHYALTFRPDNSVPLDTGRAHITQFAKSIDDQKCGGEF
jgi:hypothetical protein